MPRKVLVVGALAMVVMVPRHRTNAAQSDGSITDLGSLGRGASSASAINNDPTIVEVVGASRTATGVVHGFFWTTPGPMVDLGGLDGCESFANDINNHRQIAGVSSDPSGRRWAVLWIDVGGTWSPEKLPTLTGGCCDDARGINNGFGGDPATVALVGVSTNRAVIWTRSATGWTVDDLGTLPGDTASHASDINDQGDIVGISFNGATGIASGVLWTSTGIVRLPSLLPDSNTSAEAIANSGDIVGTSTDADGNPHAVRWRSATNWTIEDFGTLGGCCSYGRGINSFGDVVGTSNVGQQPSDSSRAFIANSMGLTDFGSRQRSSAAWAVNDFGMAVGSGVVRGTTHALLWRVQ